MKIPLGISDFGALRTQGYHYIDKTPFLAHLEDLSPLYLLFHRPPGTGKSTFLSMLAYYYDIAQAEHFDTLFRGLWVHDHPTPGRGRYLVLSLDFSGLTAEGGVEGLRAAFTDVARAAVRRFVSTHREVAPEIIRYLRPIERFGTAADLLSMLFHVVAGCNRRTFVLIDGYDDFTWALALHDPQASYEVIHDRTGFVRSLYGVLKSGTACGGVERIFIAGDRDPPEPPARCQLLRSGNGALLFAREELGLDVEAFASLLELDVATVREWEAGSREAPSKAVARCARALSLTIHELLSGDLRPDPAASQGLRPGARLDEVAKALSEGRIDRVEAHRLLDLALYELLPEHPLLSDAARAPLRSLEDDVRAIVWIRLACARRTGLRPAEVHRTEEGWRVSVVDRSGNLVAEELLSFDLEAERDKL